MMEFLIKAGSRQSDEISAYCAIKAFASIYTYASTHSKKEKAMPAIAAWKKRLVNKLKAACTGHYVVTDDQILLI